MEKVKIEISIPQEVYNETVVNGKNKEFYTVSCM